jgi:hypothetical protein
LQVVAVSDLVIDLAPSSSPLHKTWSCTWQLRAACEVVLHGATSEYRLAEHYAEVKKSDEGK